MRKRKGIELVLQASLDLLVQVGVEVIFRELVEVVVKVHQLQMLLLGQEMGDGLQGALLQCHLEQEVCQNWKFLFNQTKAMQYSKEN